MPKRRKFAPEESNEIKRARREQQLQACTELVSALQQYRSEDDRSLWTSVDNAFIAMNPQIVTKNEEDDNSQSSPLSAPCLEKIHENVKADRYTHITHLYNDLEHVLNKVKQDYESNSAEYTDANELFEFYTDVRQDINPDAQDVNGTLDEQDEQMEHNLSSEQNEHDLEDLFSFVMTATDDEQNSLSLMFRLLPAKEDYPDYYEVITEPIDLRTIGSRIQESYYNTLGELEKDLLLMVKNAKLYNEPGSQIYKNANALRKMIVTKKAEIEQRKMGPVKTSERIKAKRAPSQRWSSIAAKFSQSDSSSMQAHEEPMNATLEDSMDVDQDNFDSPEYLLYQFVRNYKNAQGATLSDPFMRLPNRRFYPDYYEEIKKPMSLGKINSKLRIGNYDNVEEVIDDMDLTFRNAMRYNRSDSKIYKDAQKLHKIMITKAKEFTDYAPPEQISEPDDSSEAGAEEEEDEEDEEEEVSQNEKKSSKSSLKAKLLLEKKVRKSILGGDLDAALKKRMRALYKSLIDYCDEEGRYPISLFMEKPSKRDYPDYYHVIANPIDMKTIDANIKNESYTSEEALLKDFRLMFENCRLYNEEGSQIYIDANHLEAALMEKARELNLTFKHKRSKVKSATERLRQLFETVLAYRDEHNRQLSQIFMKLPSRVDYPNYYEVIKRPIDLDKIANKLKQNQYEGLEDLQADIVLTFENACKFNEPDSQIYKDAVTLQQLALQTKLELVEASGEGVPDVKSLVQTLLMNLFTGVYNQQDDEGRCYIDSLLESIEHKEQDQAAEVNRPLSFSQIKANIEKGRYLRLDRFQSDVFSIFEIVRQISRTDSQAFEDSIEMQQHFIRLRNELCKNGERLESPALLFTEADLNASVENLRKQKLPFEQQETENEVKTSFAKIEGSEVKDITVNDVTFGVGDFVYVKPKEKNLEAHIIHVEVITQDEKGEPSIYGCWYYRPNETFHLASRKFLQNEVFKSDNYNETPVVQVIGKCAVVFVKDYFKQKPTGFDDKDIYVCESRYCVKTKMFKKIKAWTTLTRYELVEREKEVPIIRVQSVFKQQEEPSTDESILDIIRVNVCSPPLNESKFGVDQQRIYEQICFNGTSYKLGDFCFIRLNNGSLGICRIDRISQDCDGPILFEGARFLQRNEINLPPGIFDVYTQEVFWSTMSESHQLDQICSRCAVLSYKDYTTRRPTEIPEEHVFICEQLYNAEARSLIKCTAPLRNVSLRNPKIVHDEHYLFRAPLILNRSERDGIAETPRRGPMPFEIVPCSPMLQPETENEESNDTSFAAIDVPTTPVISTPSLKRASKTPKRIVTGYLLFAGEIRKNVVQANPARNFGDISRIIGSEWKNLPSDSKAEYEKRAQKHNEMVSRETAKLAEAEQAMLNGGTGRSDNYTYECLWERCDHQFEDKRDLCTHLILEPHGHIYRSYAHLIEKEGQPGIVFQCLVKGCPRVKKGGPPFLTFQRLQRHCREAHISKQQPRFSLPENRSKNYTPSSYPDHGLLGKAGMFGANITIQQPNQAQVNGANNVSQSQHIQCDGTQSSNLMNGAIASPSFLLNGAMSPSFGLHGPSPSTTTVPPPPIKQADNLFVAPVRPNRLLYTNTYIKYIERLNPEINHVSNWSTQLHATPENITNIDRSTKLPMHWLANKEGNHGNALSALWALRNFMFQDALKLAKP